MLASAASYDVSSNFPQTMTSKHPRHVEKFFSTLLKKNSEALVSNAKTMTSIEEPQNEFIKDSFFTNFDKSKAKSAPPIRTLSTNPNLKYISDDFAGTGLFPLSQLSSLKLSLFFLSFPLLLLGETKTTSFVEEDTGYIYGMMTCDEKGTLKDPQVLFTQNAFNVCYHTGWNYMQSYFYRISDEDVENINNGPITDVNNVIITLIRCFSHDCSEECYEIPLPDRRRLADTAEQFEYYNDFVFKQLYGPSLTGPYSTYLETQECIAKSFEYGCADAIEEDMPCGNIFYAVKKSVTSIVPEGTKMLVEHSFLSQNGAVHGPCYAAAESGLTDGFQTLPTEMKYDVLQTKVVFPVDVCVKYIDYEVTSYRPRCDTDCPTYSYKLSSKECGITEFWDNEECDGEHAGTMDVISFRNDDDDDASADDYNNGDLVANVCMYFYHDRRSSTNIYCSTKGQNVAPSVSSASNDETSKIAIAGLVIACVLGLSAFGLSALTAFTVFGKPSYTSTPSKVFLYASHLSPFLSSLSLL